MRGKWKDLKAKHKKLESDTVYISWVKLHLNLESWLGKLHWRYKEAIGGEKLIESWGQIAKRAH